MGFIDKLRYVATGKTNEERIKINQANLAIRQKAIDAALKEREIQEIRIATERERVRASERLKKLRQPKRMFNPGAGLNYFADSLKPSNKTKGRYKII